MEKIIGSREGYIELLKSFETHFYRQSIILSKESKTLQNATTFYLNNHKNKPCETLGQEIQELIAINSGLDSIINKIQVLKEQFKNKDEKTNSNKEYGAFSQLIENINKRFDNSHIGILVIIDSKIKQFQKLFDELNFHKQAYYNLIDSREFAHIPSPKFNKRFRNSNLGLFLNKQINDTLNESSFRSLISRFYKVNNLTANNETSINNFEKTRFFATWSHTNDHYIKDFKNIRKEPDFEERNIYISMSYSYLDKTIYQQVVYHEISHGMEHKKLDDYQQDYLLESLSFYKGKNIFKHNDPIDELYKEILCDLSTVYATGYSYIISLIHIGFFELHDLFLKIEDFNIYDFAENESSQLHIPKNEELSPKKFDLIVNNINLAVRLLILLELCEKLEIKDTYLDGIRFILNILFPDPSEEQKNKEQEINLLSIYKFITIHGTDYEISLNLVYSLYEKFRYIVLNDSIIKNFETNRNNQRNFITKLNEFINNSKLNSTDKPFFSIYDFLWHIRKNNNKMICHETCYERDYNRFFNIYSIFYSFENNKIEEKHQEIFNNIFTKMINNKQDIFYDLEFIKYKSNVNFHPFVEFIKNKCGLDNDSTKVSYVFAPYDLAILRKRDDCKGGHYNYPYENNASFFTDRHSLFLLKEINDGTQTNKNAGFGVIIKIKISDMFGYECNMLIFDFLLEFFIESKENKQKYNKCKIFKSIGGEDYVVYIENILLQDSYLYGKYLQGAFATFLKKSDKKLKDFNILVEDSIILLDTQNMDIKLTDEESKKLQIVIYAKINKEDDRLINFFCTDNQTCNFIKEYPFILDISIPTNRFDLIMNVKSSEQDIFNKIKQLIQDTNNTVTNLFHDFNIEIMHKIC